MKQTNKPKAKKTNILDDARKVTSKSIQDISSTIEGSRKINELLIRKSILLAEIAIKQNEINSIDKKINDTMKKNPLNDFVMKITSGLEKIEPKELTQFLEALKPLGSLFDLSKILATQKTNEISNTILTNVNGKTKARKNSLKKN